MRVLRPVVRISQWSALPSLSLALAVALVACNRVESTSLAGHDAAGAPATDAASLGSDAAAPDLSRHPDREVPISELTRERHPGAVVDPRGMLGHFDATVRHQAERFNDDLGIDFQVVIAPNRAGSIERLADEVFHLRGVGDGAPTGGLLLMIEPLRGEARFALSYELEPAFPDSILGRVARDQLAPYASYTGLGMAVMDVYHFLNDFAYLQAAEGELELAQAFRRRPGYEEARRYLAGGGGALARLSSVPADADLKARVPDAERSRYAPSADPLASIEALSRVQYELKGDPSLELFTPGSRILRERYPVAPFEEIKRAELTDASRPLRLEIEGDRAVAFSDTPAFGFVPILLRRMDGSWRVDSAEAFKNLRFTTEGIWLEVNSNHPYHFGLRRFASADIAAYDVQAFDVGGRDLGDLIDRLAGSSNPLHRYLEAELLLRNAWASVDAIARYEEAVRMAPDAVLFWDTLARRAMLVHFYELAARAFAEVGAGREIELARALERAGQNARAIASLERALERNPWDFDAAMELRRLTGDHDPAAARARDRQIQRMLDDPLGRMRPVEMTFSPDRPTLVLGPRVPLKEADSRDPIFDHGAFAITLQNQSARPVEIVHVNVSARGTAGRSDLGDHADEWRFEAGQRRLGPGESASLNRVWGFAHDTAHEQLSYVFDYCWQGTDDDARQCATRRVDLLPD